MIHTVHRRGSGARATWRAVPEGPAKWALVFGGFWLLYHGAWWWAAFFLLLTACLNIAAGMVAEPLAAAGSPWVLATFVLPLLPRLYLLLEGHEIRRAKLERQEFWPVAVVDAPDEETAVAIASIGYDRTDESASVPVAPRPAAPPPAAPVAPVAPSTPPRRPRALDASFGLVPARHRP